MKRLLVDFDDFDVHRTRLSFDDLLAVSAVGKSRERDKEENMARFHAPIRLESTTAVKRVSVATD
jgi:hypothetical protein